MFPSSRPLTWMHHPSGILPPTRHGELAGTPVAVTRICCRPKPSRGDRVQMVSCSPCRGPKGVSALASCSPCHVPGEEEADWGEERVTDCVAARARVWCSLRVCVLACIPEWEGEGREAGLPLPLPGSPAWVTCRCLFRSFGVFCTGAYMSACLHVGLCVPACLGLHLCLGT